MPRRPDVPPELTNGPITLCEGRPASAPTSWGARAGAAWDAASTRGLASPTAHCWSAGIRRRIPSAVFSGRTAAWLHGLDLPPCEPVEVTVPSDAVWGFAPGCRCIARHSLAHLRTYAEAHPRSWGIAHLRRVLDLAEPASESAMETRLRLLLVLAGPAAAAGAGPALRRAGPLPRPARPLPPRAAPGPRVRRRHAPSQPGRGRPPAEPAPGRRLPAAPLRRRRQQPDAGRRGGAGCPCTTHLRRLTGASAQRDTPFGDKLGDQPLRG